jgi:hypothetical protein
VPVPKTTAPTLTAWHAIIGFVAITAICGFIVALFVRKAIPMDQRGDGVGDPGGAPQEAGKRPSLRHQLQAAPQLYKTKG